MNGPLGCISPAYLEEQKRLHAQPEGYGGKGRKWAPWVEESAMRLPVCQTFLDYGCGQGSLALALRRVWGPAIQIREYDPAIAGKDTAPQPAHLVACTDVLEHVEPHLIQNVLSHLDTLAVHGLFLVVSLVETAKTLSDGRQAHILLRPATWWRSQFERRGFELHEFLDAPKLEKQWVALATRKAR